MDHLSLIGRALFASALALAVSACAAHGTSYAPPTPQPALVHVDVYNRTTGSTLPVYAKDGRRYIVGTPGHEYAVRIRNATGTRVLVVTSVDGVNVISGDTAAPSQSGYVLDPWGSVEIIGWRKSLERSAAFFFTEHENSYAARTGRPGNIGVIGVAAFREKAPPIALRDRELRREQIAPQAESATASTRGPAPAGAASSAADAVAPPERGAPRAAANLGTGHGRDETSRVTLVRFDRATETPSHTMTLQYDRRDNLVALGVLPPVPPRFSQREPEAFPGALRFVPNP